ncbi:MAG TPA: polysaccharide deacetylase family protein [Streptosporangiaceae bacterium]|nr:polysaccharide deacetylase family protein [Streptosporangiaceae bacterium]
MQPRAARPPYDRRLLMLAAAGVLVVVGLIVAWMGQRAEAVAQARPGIRWSVSPAANRVTIRLTPGSGPSAGRIVAGSRIVVSESGRKHSWRASPGRGMIRVPVSPGRRTQILVRVQGPEPITRTLTVTLPPRLVTTVHHTAHGLLIRASSPLRQQPPGPLCDSDQIGFPTPTEVTVARSPEACRAGLRLTARDGERATVQVNLSALPEIPFYAFASPAGRAIYITVDDGWTPSSQVLVTMERTHLPVTAFLVAQAAQRNLVYWRAFAEAGGTIADHTVSHSNLTKLSLSQATSQWAQARLALGRSLGKTPDMGRPPYGAFDPAVAAAGYQAGLKTLVGWSATVTRAGIHTWNGKRLAPGEIVLLHWVPGLGKQMTKLLAAIQARHLHPMPLTPASFAGIAPQQRSLSGD